MPSSTSAAEPHPGERVGRYVVVGELGRSPSSIVLHARDEDGRDIALKLLRGGARSDPTLRRRFEREGELAEAIDHPNVVPLLERGDADGTPFIATPLRPGGSLAERLEAGPLAVEEVVAVVRDVGAGLDVLHRAGLVHRDVKPANVLFGPDGAAIADLGVARRDADTALTRAGSVVGTADYVAPEVVLGHAAGPAADIYGLGCVAYACVTGRPPFAGRSSVVEACRGHVEETPADPGALRPELPAPFCAALLTALAKPPDDRPGSGTAYALLLRAGARGA